MVRHAGASRCTVALHRTGSSLVVEVADDGAGIEGTRRPGWGWCRCASVPRSSADGAEVTAAGSRQRHPGERDTAAARTYTHRVGRGCGARKGAERNGRGVPVLVVDDHPVFREGFAALLANIDEVEVLGTARPGVEALAQVDALRPRVVVMDVQMPEMDGIEATRRLAAEHPEVGVVVLTMSEEDGTIFDAVRAGARGYLLKGAEPDEVVRAITTVAAGGVVFGAVLAARVADFFARPPGSGRESPFPMLTAREHEVLDLVAAGMSNAQIAARLFLSQKTVRNHVHAVLSQAPGGRPRRGDRAGPGRRARPLTPLPSPWPPCSSRCARSTPTATDTGHRRRAIRRTPSTPAPRGASPDPFRRGCRLLGQRADVVGHVDRVLAAALRAARSGAPPRWWRRARRGPRRRRRRRAPS